MPPKTKLDGKDWKEINGIAISKMYELLSRDMDCTKYFAYLRSKFVLSADNCEEIRGERTRRTKTEKFLDLLAKMEDKDTVKNLITAVCKDHTVPGMKARMVDFFSEARKEYAEKHNKYEEEDDEQKNKDQQISSDSSRVIDDGPYPQPPPTSQNEEFSGSQPLVGAFRSNSPGPPPPPPPPSDPHLPMSDDPFSVTQNPVDDHAQVNVPDTEEFSLEREEFKGPATNFETSGPIPGTVAQHSTSGNLFENSGLQPITIPEVSGPGTTLPTPSATLTERGGKDRKVASKNSHPSDGHNNFDPISGSTKEKRGGDHKSAFGDTGCSDSSLHHDIHKQAVPSEEIGESFEEEGKKKFENRVKEAAKTKIST
eukprot:m.308829 g.308829  ORF g.308829 m.308829 type:complete len:369 (+) comp44935_c0_seq1:69-1175(+)